ncbi:MAG: DUF3347 domain-containing protein [Chitinophagaceae bacterium]|nr:DUF3347 domain-containing protein [Bacteroidota bacterium]MCC6258200.1 DUF3347 domain-containing protein [Chitinophagaceae bacterium]MCW5916149.1 DUF3347 domain-containing protein [Ferruginibacter sp.]
MKKILFLLMSFSFCLGGYAQNKTSLVKNYVAIKNALVKSDQDLATAAIKTFYSEVKKEGEFDKKKELLAATEKLNNAKGLEKQREAFMNVSTTLWSIVKSGDKVNQPVFYQYCPMKKAYWLSTEKEIRNPYYGDAMLTCGKVVEKTN